MSHPEDERADPADLLQVFGADVSLLDEEEDNAGGEEHHSEAEQDDEDEAVLVDRAQVLGHVLAVGVGEGPVEGVDAVLVAEGEVGCHAVHEVGHCYGLRVDRLAVVVRGHVVRVDVHSYR